LKSDVWSLGCILYAFTYGEPPFAHITKQEKKIAAIMHDEVVYPKKSINPQLLDVLKVSLYLTAYLFSILALSHA
jgi:serine/threonine protein kinase